VRLPNQGRRENRPFQKNLYLCRVPLTRHSANNYLCRVSLHQHSAKSICFAECHHTSTRQRAYTLPSADLGYSAKSIHFAECFSQAFGKRPSPFLPPSRSFFLPRAGLGTRQSLCRVPDKKHSAKRPLPTLSLLFPLCRVQHSALGKGFAECLRCFAECVRHSANEASPVVNRQLSNLNYSLQSRRTGNLELVVVNQFNL
jgi:hypothetical protein